MIIITKIKSDTYFVTSNKEIHGPLTQAATKACAKWFYKIEDAQLNIAFSIFFIGKYDMAIFSNDGKYKECQKVNDTSEIVIDT